MMSKIKYKLTKKLRSVYVVKVDAILIVPMRKIYEILITPPKENLQEEMLKILIVKWVRSWMDYQ